MQMYNGYPNNVCRFTVYYLLTICNIKVLHLTVLHKFYKHQTQLYNQKLTKQLHQDPWGEVVLVQLQSVNG